MGVIKILFISEVYDKVTDFYQKVVDAWQSLIDDHERGECVLINCNEPMDIFLDSYFSHNEKDKVPQIRLKLTEQIMSIPAINPSLIYSEQVYKGLKFDEKKKNLVIIYGLDNPKKSAGIEKFKADGFVIYHCKTNLREAYFKQQYPSILEEDYPEYLSSWDNEKNLLEGATVLNISNRNESIKQLINLFLN